MSFRAANSDVERKRAISNMTTITSGEKLAVNIHDKMAIKINFFFIELMIMNQKIANSYTDV